MTVRPGIASHRLEQIRPDRREERTDTLAVESALELRVDGEPRTVLLRTPGDDVELMAGLLFAEGVLCSPEEARLLERPESDDEDERNHVLELHLPRATVDERWPERTLYANSACGACGKRSIENLAVRASPCRSNLTVDRAVVTSLPDHLRAAQKLFDATGGVHAAGAFSGDGTALAVREDVGRHNAVDKVVGWGLAENGIPFENALLCVSGRVSFEIVQKAIMAGFPIVVAVSAPTSMAVELAERYRITVCGFTRGDRFNVYSHPARIV